MRFPHKESFKLISEIEGYNRRYYSGFLGEINLESKSASLFVNLRCAELIKDLLNIYVGAGITNESIPTLDDVEYLIDNYCSNINLNLFKNGKTAFDLIIKKVISLTS